MTKELDALEKILNNFVEILLETKCEKPTVANITYLTNSLRVAFRNELGIIENAFNDNYFYKYMISKICGYMGLDINPFENLATTENEMKNYIFENECFRVDVATNKNKLKALDVIKEKRVNACEIINSKDVREYNWSIHTPKKYPLTQEDRDLLKEVLK